MNDHRLRSHIRTNLDAFLHLSHDAVFLPQRAVTALSRSALCGLVFVSVTIPRALAGLTQIVPPMTSIPVLTLVGILSLVGRLVFQVFLLGCVVRVTANVSQGQPEGLTQTVAIIANQLAGLSVAGAIWLVNMVRFVLFIVPGIFWSFSSAYWLQVMVLEPKSKDSPFSRSRTLTDGYWGTIFIIWALIGLISTILLVVLMVFGPASSDTQTLHGVALVSRWLCDIVSEGLVQTTALLSCVATTVLYLFSRAGLSTGAVMTSDLQRVPAAPNAAA